MAQSTDTVQLQEDPSLGEDSAGGKTSFFGRLKDKTKDQGKKLKTKLKPSSKTSTDDVPGSYDEEDSPTSDSMDGQETSYDQQPSYGSEESAPEPTQNFPGDFAGVVDDKTVAEAKADDSGLSKDFEALSTNEKSGSEDKEVTPAPESGLADESEVSDKTTELMGEPAPESGTADEYETSEPTTESNSTPVSDSGIADKYETGEQTKESNDTPVSDSGVADKYESSEQTTQLNATPVSDSGVADESESSEQTSDSIQDKMISAKDETTEKLFGGGAGSEQQYASPDSPATSEQPEELGEGKATEAGRTWTGWAAEKVGLAKETAASKAPATADGMPVHEKAYDAAVDAKDSVAAQTDMSSIPSDPAQQTYIQKAAQTVQSTLGYGQNTTASSPTTTPVATEESLQTPSGEAPPQSPGIVSRITGLFSASKPTSEDTTPTSKEATTETETL